MIVKYLLSLLFLFWLVMSFPLVINAVFFVFTSYSTNTPSVSVLDATHTKILYADSSEYASSFIPEFLR